MSETKRHRDPIYVSLSKTERAVFDGAREKLGLRKGTFARTLILSALREIEGPEKKKGR